MDQSCGIDAIAIWKTPVIPSGNGTKSVHLFIIFGIRRLCARAPTGESRPLSSPLVRDITHKNQEETDKHLSGPPDSMIASQGT
jgi:hypothetical protein